MLVDVPAEWRLRRKEERTKKANKCHKGVLKRQSSSFSWKDEQHGFLGSGDDNSHGDEMNHGEDSVGEELRQLLGAIVFKGFDSQRQAKQYLQQAKRSDSENRAHDNANEWNDEDTYAKPSNKKKVKKWMMNHHLLSRVLQVLHLIVLPNSISEKEFEYEVKKVMQDLEDTGDVWCWLGQQEKKTKSMAKMRKLCKLEKEDRLLANSMLHDMGTNGEEEKKMEIQEEQADEDEDEAVEGEGIWCLQEGSYRNILHQAVEDNDLSLTRRIGQLLQTEMQAQSHPVNQSDREENTPLHVAGRSLHLPPLLQLLHYPQVDITLLNRNGRTFFHELLLKLITVTKFGKKDFPEVSVLHHILEVSFHKEPRERILSCFILEEDNCGHNLIDLAIMSGAATVVTQLVDLMVSIAEEDSQSSTCSISSDIEWSRYVKGALLVNKASIVLAVVEPFLRSVNVLNVDHDGYVVMLAGYMTFAIDQNCLTALMTLLTCKEFVRAINVLRGNYSNVSVIESLPPLLASVGQCHHSGNLHAMLILLKFGANPLVRVVEPSSLLCVLSHHKKTDPFEPFAHLESVVMHESTFRLNETTKNYHDNIFSYVAAAMPSHPSTVTVDMIRALSMATPHAACFVPTFTRRAQADEVAITIPTNASIDDFSTSLHFFFDYACCLRNPLVSCILTGSAIERRLNRKLNKSYFNHQPFHQADASNCQRNDELRNASILEYLLFHTPFVKLIDLQEGYSGLTPLACACWTGNIFALDQLLRHGASPLMKMNGYLLNPPLQVNERLSETLEKWHLAVQNALRHKYLPNISVKKSYIRLTEYTIEVKRLITDSLAALDAVTDKSLEVLRSVSWKESRNSATSSGYVLPANTVTFLDHFIQLLWSLSPQDTLPEPDSIDFLINPNIVSQSDQYTSNEQENLEELRYPQKLFKKARNVLVDVSKRMSISNVMQCDGLSRVALHHLRGMDKFYTFFQSNIRTDASNKVASLSIRHIQQSLSTWSRGLLQLHTLTQDLKQEKFLDAGLCLFDLITAKCELDEALRAFIIHQRVHTAHNYLVQREESLPSHVACSMYEKIFETVTSSEASKKLDVLWKDGLAFHASLSGHVPLLSSRCNRRRVGSIRRSDRLWWWDAVEAQHWSLVRVMLPDICLEESSQGVEELALHLLQHEAPAELLHQLSCYGVRFGRLKSLVELAVAKLDPIVLMDLLLHGSYCESHFPEFWHHLLDLFRQSQDRPQIRFRHHYSRYKDASTPYDSVRDLLEAGLVVAQGEDKALEQAVLVGSDVFTLCDRCSRDASTSLKSVDNTNDSFDSDDSNDSDDSVNKDCVLHYKNLDSMVRSTMGQTIMRIYQPSDAIASTAMLLGFVGFDGDVVHLPVVPTLNLIKCKTLMDVSSNKRSVFHPLDRFLLSPIESLASLHPVVGGSKRFIRELYKSASSFTTTSLFDALRDLEISPCFLSLPVESHGGDTNEQLPAILFAARCGNISLVSSLLEEYLDCSKGKINYQCGNIRNGFREFCRFDSSGELEVNVKVMSKLLNINAETRVSRANQRYQCYVSAIRGRFHYYATLHKTCELRNIDGSTSKTTYSKLKLPVQTVMSMLMTFCQCTVALKTCAASWLHLHRSGVFNCQYTVSMNKNDLHNASVSVGSILNALEIHDAYSLHAFVFSVQSAPFRTTYKVVQAAATIANEGLESFTQPFDVSNELLASWTSSGSISLKPMTLWQQWIDSIGALLGYIAHLRLLSTEIDDLQLSGQAFAYLQASESALLSDWMSESNESSVDEHLVSIEEVLVEVLAAETALGECHNISKTVNFNLHCLDAASSLNTPTCNEHYYRETSPSDDHKRTSNWFHEACIPLLCFDANALSNLLMPSAEGHENEYDMDLMKLLNSTSKSIYYLFSQLLGTSSSELRTMSPQDIFRKLVKHSEMLCTLHHDDRHDRVVSSSFDAFLTQLDVQLQDSILAQIVKAVEVRVSSLEETLLDLLRKEREVSGHTAGRQESSPKSSAAIDLKSTLETHLRLASHFLVFTKACRCKVKGLLTGESEQDMSRKHVPLVPNTRDARLSLLLSESVKSRSASLVRFILTHVTRDDDDDNGDAYGGIGRAIWEEACALGDKDVVTALLEHASPLAGQWKPMETSSPPKKTNWSIVHCALSGFSAELHATQHLKTELTVSPGIRLGEDVLQCFLRGSSNFAGVCPNAKDNAGHIRRSIALTLISTSPYFYSPRRDEREDFEKYPYSVLDLCAGVGCWSGVEFILNHESNIFSISNTSACTPCLFMHHCMLNANEKALDVFMRQLIASRKSIDQVQYKTNLRQLGRMLSSKRLFPHPSTPHVMTAHYLIHDALLSKSETLIKKLLWITKSIMDQLRDDNAMDSYDRHMSFIDGLPHATSSHFDVIEGNLYHYAVLSGSRKVVKYLFEAGLPNSPHSESKLAFVPIRPVILRKRRSHELFQDLIEYCPDFLTPLQVAMRWGSTECLELILQVGPDMYSAEMSRRLLLEAICYCQLESSAACFTFHFLTERLFMRLLKNDNYHLENNKTNMFQLCIQTKYHQPKVSIANQFASDVSQHDSCLFPEKDLLTLQNYCFEVRWPSVCCLLIQCHFVDILMNPSDREELLIDAHYQALYRRAIEHGCEEVAVAIFLFYQESAAAEVMHMTPPLLVLDDVMRSNGDMFYRLLNTAANSSVMSPHHGSDASPVKDESTSVSMFDVSSQPDDILIDLNNFRSLLLEAEHTNSGDALEGSLHHPPNNIIEAALSLSELKTPPEDEDSPNRAEHMADANKERSSRNGDSSSERDSDDSPVQSPGQGDLLVPGLGSTAKKRVVVIRTRDGRKATFYVNSKI